MAKKNRNDQIFTPDKYVEDMLDRIGYVKNLIGKTILENSCGQGNILVPIEKSKHHLLLEPLPISHIMI